MFDSIFFHLSQPAIKELLSVKEYVTLYNAVDKYNFTYFPDHPIFGECTTKEIPNEDMTILVLLALRYIRSTRISGCNKITDQHFSNAVIDMRDIWNKLCLCSYRFQQIVDLEYFEDIDNREIFVNEAEKIFDNILFAIGEIKKTKHLIGYFNDTKFGTKSSPTPFSDDEIVKLKESVNYLLSLHSPLDDLPMDIVKVLDKELYNLKYKDYKQRNGIVSWYNIINQIKCTDQLLVVKDFLDRAIKSTVDEKEVKDTIIDYLDSKVDQIRNNQTATSITNNYNAPIGQVVQEQHVDHLNTK